MKVELELDKEDLFAMINALHVSRSHHSKRAREHTDIRSVRHQEEANRIWRIESILRYIAKENS